jgi:K+-transporting ATPase c subunit
MAIDPNDSLPTASLQIARIANDVKKPTDAFKNAIWGMVTALPPMIAFCSDNQG